MANFANSPFFATMGKPVNVAAKGFAAALDESFKRDELNSQILTSVADNNLVPIMPAEEDIKTVEMRKVARIHSSILARLKKAQPLANILVAIADALADLCQEQYTNQLIHDQLISVYGRAFEQPPVIKLERQDKEKKAKQLKAVINSGSLPASTLPGCKETLLNLQKEIAELKAKEKAANEKPIEVQPELYKISPF